jgi:O-antigen/teichoic acid export membrane protein
MHPEILGRLFQSEESKYSAEFVRRLTLKSRILLVVDKLRPRRWMQGTLAKDWSNLFAGQSIRLVLQGVYFLCVSRSLGPAQYGAFVAVTAMANIFSPYAGLGCGPLFQKNVRSGRREPALCWGNGLLATISTGMLGTAMLCALAFLWLPNVPIFTIAAICVSDLIMARIVDLASSGFAASGIMSKTAVQNTIMSVLRVIGIVLLILRYREVTAAQWAWAYLITSIIGALFAFQQGMSLWGAPHVSFPALYEDMREGSFFSLSTSAQTVYNDIDKTMLARLSTFSATGIYAAAYRLIDTSLTPVRSLVSAAYPEVFRVGTAGIGATYSYARRLIRKSLIFGLVDFLGLIIIAPLLPHILGPKYAGITQAVQLLAFIPIMRCVHWFLADALSGANAHALRAYIQVGVAFLNTGLNFLVLPRWSWVGAAWTSLASDAALLGAVYFAVQWKRSVSSIPEAVHATE